MERIEGLAKLTGAERYVDDLAIEGVLWGMTVRSPAPRGRIRAIRFGPAVDWSEIVVVDHRDVPGENTVLLIERDQPVLAADRVRHLNDVIIPRLARRRPQTVTIVDLHAKVCPEGQFTDVVEGVDGVRPDALHFSQDGSKWLAEWLGPQVTAIAGRSRLSRDESPRESAGTSVSFVRGTTSR